MSTSILLPGIFLVIVLLALAARLLNCRHFFLCVMCVFVCSKWDCGPQAFLADTMETGDITKAMHRIESCENKDVKLFRNRLVHEFYHLKKLITLEQMITSVVEKKEQF